MSKNKPQIEALPVTSLVPYAKNSRTHSDEQVAQVAASIKEFGFTNPILVDGDNVLIAGHGRLLAAQRLGLNEVPCIRLSHLTESQKRAYVIADNKLAMNAGWDDDLLMLEIGDLKDDGFDLSLTGFSEEELAQLSIQEEVNDSENPYTDKVSSPIYEPTGDKPDVSELFDDSKTFELVQKIQESTIPEHEKNFLRLAAGRHTVLNFDLIAEYYAHSSKDCQNLMEDNALVIIDFDKAIENGYVSLKNKISDQYIEEYDED